MADLTDGIRNKTCKVDNDSDLSLPVDESFKSSFPNLFDQSKRGSCSPCDSSPRLLTSDNRNNPDPDSYGRARGTRVRVTRGVNISRSRSRSRSISLHNNGAEVVGIKCNLMMESPKRSLSTPSLRNSMESIRPTVVPPEVHSQKQISDFDNANETMSNLGEIHVSDSNIPYCDPLGVHAFADHHAPKEYNPKLSDLSMLSEDNDDDDDDDDDEHLDLDLCRCRSRSLSRSTKEMKRLSSSSLSTLSDDQDTVDLYGFLDLLEKSDLSSDDMEFYNDWDPGLNSFGNDDLHGGSSPDMMDDSDSDFEITGIDLPFPHRAQHIMECEICVSMTFVRRRVCCDYQICNKCLATYITMKVKEGKVQMECPNDRCDVLVYKDEIHYRLSPSMREKFSKYLIDANADPHIKTCPSCSLPHHIDPALLNVSKRKLKHGVKVLCEHCKLEWCFPCHAPYHTSLTCKKYKKEDEMVKRWAKERKDGMINAQKCPKCKVYIQKKDGCDHMRCSRCNTDFCYRCGDRYISIKLLGNHWSRFSLFGCKYRLLPQKPVLRRLIRGTNFGARLVAAVALAGLGVAAGAVLLGVGVFIVPVYGILHLRRNMWARKRRKKFLRQKRLMLAAAQREKELLNCRDIVFLDSHGYMSTIPEESETETSNPTSDPQQIQVLVHRSVSFNREDAEDKSKDCDILVNKYVNDGSGVFVSRAIDESDSSSDRPKRDEVIMVTDVQEILNENGYSTVVCNIVSKVESGSSESEGDCDCDGITEVGEAQAMQQNEIIKPNADITQDGALTQVSKNKFISSVDVHLQETPGKNGESLDRGIVEKTKKKDCSTILATELDGVLACYEANKLIDETDEKEKEKGGKLTDNDEKLKEKDGRLKEKEEKLKEKDDKLKEKDEKLKEKDDKLKEKDTRLKEKEEKLKEKDVKLKEKDEKLKEKDDKLKEKDEKLKEREVHVSKSRSMPEKASTSEVSSAKTANNGCFGSIFSSSKRAESPVPENQEALKSDAKSLKAKDLFSPKSATWEKCRKTNSEPVQKAPVDGTPDIKQLPYYVQKSPSSLSSIISFGYGVEDEGKVKGNESFVPVLKSDTPAEPEELHRVAENGYLSQFKFVTYL